MRKRLSLLIPLILVIVSLTSTFLIYLQEDRANRAEVEKQAIDEVNFQMGRLQNVLYNRLTVGDEQEALLSLSLAATHPSIRSLMLVDEHHHVQMANRYGWKGESAESVSGYGVSEAEMTLKSSVSRLGFNLIESTLLQGYFPLIIEYKRGGLEKVTGLLYVEHDISHELHDRTKDTLQQTAVFASITLLASIVVGLLLHWLVTKRVNILTSTSARLAAGDYSARTDLIGEDELSELGQSFDLMAHQVTENIAKQELATRNQKRVTDTTQEGYWLADNRGNLLEVNDAYCAMSGYSRDELLQMRIADLEAQEATSEEVRAHMEYIFEHGSDRFETHHRRKDGQLFDVEVSTTYWKDSEKFFVFIHDISERKQLIRRLEREQALLSEAQKMANFGSWELNLLSGKLEWSAEIFKIFEIDPLIFSASYEAFLNVIHPDDREAVNNAYSRSLEDRNPYQITHRLMMTDGRIKWVEERCSNYFDDKGKAVRSVGTVQDVTEREETSAQLRIAAVAFDTQEAIMVTYREANIIKVNRAFEVTTGYSEKEVIGQNPRILQSGRHDKAFYQLMWEDISSVGRWSGEVWDRRKNGEAYPKWLTITAVKNRGEISNYVAVFVDITERKKAEEEIRNLAFYDPLTHLPNRRLLLDRMRLALAQSARDGSYGALMFLDLDHFKILNDTKGHEYGDKMLVEVAQRMTSCVRDTDSVARFGGDEFVVLLEGMSPVKDEAIAQAGAIAEKIRELLSRPYEIEGHVHESSPSIGVILFFGEEIEIDELFKRADLAMYQAKESGRNMVRFFEPAMQAILESRTLMERALRQALPNDELSLHFQVQTNKTNQLLGAEVLLRWNSNELGFVSPAQFITLAEKTKLILPIGHWVLQRACHQLNAWSKHSKLSQLHLAVNISPVQFHQPDFVRQVKTILAETGANPKRLELELTENLVLEDIEEAIRKMTSLTEIGVRFSMDDFGTGYSSLQYIKRLPISQLKIDQSFVRDILTDPGDAMMVQTIAGMARNFGYEVIAEGVEEHAKLMPLIERGCENFQGYFFSRPVALPEFEKLIDEWELHLNSRS